MKLLQVISSMNPQAGGPCQGVRNLVPRVCELGHSVEVVCLDDPNSDYLTSETVSIHPLGKGIGRWCYHSALRPWLEENVGQFDALILNGMWQYPGYLLSSLARQQSTPPFFVYPHGMLDPWFQQAPERRLKAIRNWFYWKLIEHQVIHNAEAVLFTCGQEMCLAQKTFRPYQPKRQINVGFGVSQPPACHAGMTDLIANKFPHLKGRPYLLFLGRIDPKKGVDILIQAFAANYTTKGNEQQASTCLVIAGPGMDTPYGREMLMLAAKTCPPESVFFPGMLSGDVKWGAFYNAAAFVLTSHQENFGIAVGEALACGTPVLISNKINICREIDEDQAGLVAEDTLAGAEQLLRKWDGLSQQEIAKMKRAAQHSYETRFGIAHAARNLVKMIQELAPRSQARCIA
jgi:glycosyltransferase involved in cell wall biosynthesis